MKKNYIIPYGKRFTSIGGYVFKATTLMCVDNIGLIVEHPPDQKPTDDDVRRHLIGWSEQNEVVIQANSLQEALQEFLDWPECKIGIKHKAIELINSKERPVIEYIGCKHMKLDDWIRCTRYDEPGEKSNMVCILDGISDPPTDCPILAQMEKMEWRSEVVEIGSIWVKRFSKSVKEMDEQINGIIPRKI